MVLAVGWVMNAATIPIFRGSERVAHGVFAGIKKPGIPAGLQLEKKAVLGSASNLQIDCLRALAATIRFRVEAHFLIF